MFKDFAICPNKRKKLSNNVTTEALCVYIYTNILMFQNIFWFFCYFNILPMM